MLRKAIIIALLSTLTCSAADEPNTTSADVLSARLDAQLLRVDQLLDQGAQRDAQLMVTGAPSLSETQRRAEQYIGERAIRQALATEVVQLTRIMREILLANAAEKARLEEKLATRTRLEKPQPITMTVDNQDPDDPENPTGFSYFQVKEPANLRDIAAKTEVYGDAGMWRLLHNSNPGLVPDEKTPVKAGALLIVPNLLVMREYPDDAAKPPEETNDAENPDGR